MKKDKVYELRIDEEDEISGIDSISLVDEPAIEINWVAFKKEKQEEFHVPDNEDSKFLQMFEGKGHLEQELLDEGWEVESIEELGSHNFGLETTPNDESAEDTEQYRVRYKYGLSKNISQNPIIQTTREYCRTLINKNLVFRIEDILSLNPNSDPDDGGFGGSPQFYRGGYNCRHRWFRILYKNAGKIVNKSSINKNKVRDDAGRSPELTAEWAQPSLVTGPTKNAVKEGTAAPSTARNLGLSKVKMEIDDQNVNVFGYHTRYFAICPKAQELFRHLVSMEVDEDTMGMIRSAAQAADNVFRIEIEVVKEEQSSEHQYEEAEILVDDMKDIMVEVDKIVGMEHDTSFMDNHIEVIEEYLKDDLGYDVGGLPAYVDEVTTGKTKNNFETYDDYPESAKNQACKVLKWRDEHGDEVKGMTRIGWTRANQLCKGENISESTIARMAAFARHRKNAEVAPEFKSTPWKDKGYVAWLGWGGTSGIEWASRKLESIRRKKMSKEKFEIENEDQRTIVGVAMVPDKNIFRKDAQGNPYYVYFTKETIKMIADKYMKNKYTDNNDLDHNGKAVRDVYVVESWIVEDEEYDKSRKYGFNVPVGSWLVKMKVAKTPKGDLVWEKVKKGELNGFSVSGYFEEIATFAREEMFLKKVVEILMNTKD